MINWKQLVSMALAGGAAAVITVISNKLAPLEPLYAQAGIAGFVAAVVHKINIWGGSSETKVQS